MRSQINRHLASLFAMDIPYPSLARLHLTSASATEPLRLGLPREISWRDYAVYLLHVAAEIEHSLMVQYLYAAYSLGGPGFQVDRARFDTLIMNAAKKAGVTVFQPAKAADIATNSGQRSTLVVRHADGNVVGVDCNFLIDATGRASALGGRRKLTGAQTIALYAYWKDAAIEGPETRVEAGPAEWFWGAPLPDGLFNATVFVESGRLRKNISEAKSVDCLYHTGFQTFNG